VIEVVSFYDPILSKMDQKVKGSHSSAAVHLNHQLRVIQSLYKRQHKALSIAFHDILV
jgi:hypothetical protein